jgi:hypothetical protein
MRHSGFRRWIWLGGVASAVVLSVGCGRIPPAGGRSSNEPPLTVFGSIKREAREGDVDRFHVRADRGYNGTIAQLGSSIDPRTPEKAGTPGRSRMVDISGYTGRPDLAEGANEAPTSQGIGGSSFEGQSGGKK